MYHITIFLLLLMVQHGFTANLTQAIRNDIEADCDSGTIRIAPLSESMAKREIATGLLCWFVFENDELEEIIDDEVDKNDVVSTLRATFYKGEPLTQSEVKFMLETDDIDDIDGKRSDSSSRKSARDEKLELVENLVTFSRSIIIAADELTTAPGIIVDCARFQMTQDMFNKVLYKKGHIISMGRLSIKGCAKIENFEWLENLQDITGAFELKNMTGITTMNDLKSIKKIHQLQFQVLPVLKDSCALGKCYLKYPGKSSIYDIASAMPFFYWPTNLKVSEFLPGKPLRACIQTTTTTHTVTTTTVTITTNTFTTTTITSVTKTSTTKTSTTTETNEMKTTAKATATKKITTSTTSTTTSPSTTSTFSSTTVSSITSVTITTTVVTSGGLVQSSGSKSSKSNNSTVIVSVVVAVIVLCLLFLLAFLYKRRDDGKKVSDGNIMTNPTYSAPNAVRPDEVPPKTNPMYKGEDSNTGIYSGYDSSQGGNNVYSKAENFGDMYSGYHAPENDGDTYGGYDTPTSAKKDNTYSGYSIPLSTVNEGYYEPAQNV
eukprot:m.23319 g.23319  ORF g.23319 m.23319 type:complete len:547 (-) comp7489_c0_seq1:85-1725(-)